MVRKKRDLQTLILEYRKLVAAALAHEGELPSLARFRVALQATLEEIAAAKNRQTNFEALRREATQDLWSHVADGREAAARLTSFVRANFGCKRERLEASGITLGGRRSKPSEKKKGGTTPPEIH